MRIFPLFLCHHESKKTNTRQVFLEIKYINQIYQYHYNKGLLLIPYEKVQLTKAQE